MRISVNSQTSITPFRQGNEKWLYKRLNNHKVLEGLLSIPQPYTLETAQSWVDENLGFYKENAQHINWVIRDENDTLIGGIGHKTTPGINFAHSTEIGYWLSEEHWGKGIITKCVKSFTRYLIEKEGFTRISAVSFTTNKASSKVLEKSGYKLEGILNKFVAKNGQYINCFLFAYIN